LNSSNVSANQNDLAELTTAAVCNTPKKCIFVRIVDTCAGCKANSKHVDLTKAAFAELADVDQGILKVQFRTATHPKEWFVGARAFMLSD
jgi:expansin (peptidoglycan-binding protein)